MRLNELARAYEARHYGPTHRLDLQGHGPDTARQRALKWIQSFAHEEPGANLLLVVERGNRRSPRKSAIRTSVEALLEELKGGLIDWWQPFAEGSLALRVAAAPQRVPPAPPPPEDPHEGRTAETAGRAYLHPELDIPEELLPLARRAAELRRVREGQAVGLFDVVLREVWIEAQAHAMGQRTDWEHALGEVLRREEARMWEDEE